MDTLQPVEVMTDDEVLTTFGTADDPERRGFDAATHTRVLAYELVRARSRLAYYRTLYTAFIEGNRLYMIENLDESTGDGAIPAKLIFTNDTGHVLEIEDQPDIVIWTEAALLEAVAQVRALVDYFTELLNELEPALLDA